MGTFLSIAMGHAAGGCTTKGCHAGISDIVPMQLEMMQLIKKNGWRHGDPDGCVVCHGGNPNTSKKKHAHKSIPKTLLRAAGPKDFYPDPGSIWIAKNTCGVCHPGFVYRAERSLMNTEAGIIQGNLHAWGIDSVENHRVPFGNYDITDTDGPVPLGATKAYAAYMADMARRYPDQYPTSLLQLPGPDIGQIEQDPRLAGFTLQRRECQRCHLGVRGSRMEGDYRGMGCSACHMPYANDGFYQGRDASIPKNRPGHIQTHQLRGNRKTGGIPVETCNACHSRGKKIGISFQGLMTAAFQTPFDEKGNPQSKLHGKNYLKLSGDLHHNTDNSRIKNPKGGLLCQDCHTSHDVHGDGNIHGTTLAQVEIECTDCHGTPEKLPWELPLGHMDEFGKDLSLYPSRGLTREKLLSARQFGFNYESQDGFLLTARGNPLGNVVKSGDGVIVHSAKGLDFKVPVLAQIAKEKKWKNPAARTAMESVSAHLKRMECYTCHAALASQSYGSFVRVDYGTGLPLEIDWVATGNSWMKNGSTSESKRGSKGILSPGKVEKEPAFLRWEDPVLGINGEGNISPLMPGSQVVYTVIGPDGNLLALNRIAGSPGSEKDSSLGKNPGTGPLRLDTAPVQPHTSQRTARSCENCHTSPKTAGLGMTCGINVPQTLYPQMDWAQITTRQGTALATVGTHWPLSRAFNREEIEGFLRIGTCMGCHNNMGSPEFWKKVSTKGRLDSAKHMELMNQLLNKTITP